MCGVLFTNKKNLKAEDSKRALKLMKHRGPDNQNFYFKNGIFLGHARLSIIDLDKRADQPFRHNNLLLSYNGEIYNYKELILEHNLTVTTKSDTEVVLLMYEKYGKECLNYFNGMFAFIIFNEESNKLFVARDRLGIKPLYFTNSGDEWIFSSEIASILDLEESEFDEFGIRQYRKLRMTIKGHTIYKKIKMFPPAHYFIDGKFQRYWDLDMEEKKAPSYEKLKWFIEDAIKLRKRSDVPVGSYLSGGLDSTILSCLLKPTHTWTVGFKELNEFKWSEIANTVIDTKHHKTLVDKPLFLATADLILEKRREPLSVPNEILIYLMTKNVKKENTVVLSGEGADELFFGYDRIFKWANSSDSLDFKIFDSKYCYGTHNDDEIIEFALESLPGEKVIDKIAYFFQIYHLHGLLRRLDNSTMMCSVEARVPFVDHRLIELIAGTPFQWRMGHTFKDPLKKIFSSVIPKRIIAREKIGFPVPLENIFVKNHKGIQKSPMDFWLDYNIDFLLRKN